MGCIYLIFSPGNAARNSAKESVSKIVLFSEIYKNNDKAFKKIETIIFIGLSLILMVFIADTL